MGVKNSLDIGLFNAAGNELFLELRQLFVGLSFGRAIELRFFL